MSPTALLKVAGLYKNFGGVQAIHDLSFELAKGERGEELGAPSRAAEQLQPASSSSQRCLHCARRAAACK